MDFKGAFAVTARLSISGTNTSATYQPLSVSPTFQYTSSGTQTNYSVYITPTYNFTSPLSTTHTYDLYINRTETSIHASANHYLIWAGVAAVNRFNITNTGNINMGVSTSTATATPLCINMGGTYGNSAAGNAANLKWRMYDDGAGTVYGIGMSAGLIEYQAGSSGDAHAFFSGAAKTFGILGTGATQFKTNVWQTSFTDNKQRIYFEASSTSYWKSGNDSGSNISHQFRAHNDVNLMSIHGGASISVGTTTANGRVAIVSGTTAADGIYWGTDVTLYRSAADTLKTDDNLIVALKADITNRLLTGVGNPSISASAWTPNCDNGNLAHVDSNEAGGALTVNAPGGTPSNGQKLILRIKNTNATALTLTFNATYKTAHFTLGTITNGNTSYYGFIYNSTATAAWDLVAVTENITH